MRQVITSFAGLRAHEDSDDFVIGEAKDAKGFINAAGIESPGLSSAPAVAEMVTDIVKELLPLEKNPDFIGTRKGILRPDTLSLEERNKLIKEHPEYGNIICRCEMITEGEIMDSIHRCPLLRWSKTSYQSRHGTLSGRFLFSSYHGNFGA